MSTITRQIDALGGTADLTSSYGLGYNQGYADALNLATPIAELADAQIAELIEIIEDMLTGSERNLAEWAAYARRTINGIKAERDRA